MGSYLFSASSSSLAHLVYAQQSNKPATWRKPVETQRRNFETHSSIQNPRRRSATPLFRFFFQNYQSIVQPPWLPSSPRCSPNRNSTNKSKTKRPHNNLRSHETPANPKLASSRTQLSQTTTFSRPLHRAQAEHVDFPKELCRRLRGDRLRSSRQPTEWSLHRTLRFPPIQQQKQSKIYLFIRRIGRRRHLLRCRTDRKLVGDHQRARRIPPRR